MAKNLSNIILSGSVGELTFTKNGDVRERVRTRKRSVTPKAIRSKITMSSMMAVFSLIKDELLATHEDCPNKGVASNLFVKYNWERTHTWVPKPLADGGACLVIDYQVSHGSLYRIEQQLDGEGRLSTDIRLTADITAATTVGQFAKDLLDNNPHFGKGDVLKLLYLKQIVDGNPPLPRIQYQVDNVCLNPKDDTLLAQVVRSHPWCRRDGCLSLTEPLEAAGAAFIHISQAPGGRRLASTQDLRCRNPLAAPYLTEEAFREAFRSYGGKEADYLSPD